MFKPYTTEQGRVYLFLKERFMLEQCLVSPISCSALLLEDQNGCKFAFAFQENDVRQIGIGRRSEPSGNSLRHSIRRPN